MFRMILGDYRESNFRIITTVLFILLLYFGITLPLLIIYGIILLLEIVKVILSFRVRIRVRNELTKRLKEEAK